MFDKNMKYGILLLALLTMQPGASRADLDDMSHLEDDTRVVAASVGYRWVDTEGNANRAAEYSYLDDSATFDMLVRRDLENEHFSLSGDFNNKNDYLFEGEFNYKALFRLNAMTQRLYHNLDHFPYNSAVLDARVDTDGSYEDLDTNAIYGRRITIDEVKVRGKLPTYPAHINLAVWRMEKKGHEQLRFVSEGCFSGGCHMSSTTRQVDRVTEEVKAGFDAHLGPVDIAFLQTLRTFKEKAANPLDSFDAHAPMGRDAGDYEHDVTPDSKLAESTFMVNLPPSGGFVTSASYTLGKRESNSSVTGVTPTDTETDYHKLAADVTYTPGENWTFNFRYRMFELDSEVPVTQSTSGSTRFNNGTVPVRNSIDIDSSNYAAYISYRPTHKTTFKGEFERKVVERSDTGDDDTFSSGAFGPSNDDLDWALPEEETTDRFRLSFYTRMLKKSALTFRGWYQHVDVDNPAYGTTLTDSNELFLSSSYKPSMHWGATGSIDLLSGEGSGRDKERENLALGMWFIPNEIVSADINYGLMNTNIDEKIQFGSDVDYTIQSDADYELQVHTISAGINLRPTEIITCRLEGYHIRSKASFDPYFVNTSLNVATDDDLKEISEVDIRQNGLKARLNWKLTEMLTAGIEYTFDDYEDRNSSTFDGTAQTLMASLSGSF